MSARAAPFSLGVPSAVDLTTAATAAEVLGVPADAGLARLITAASTAIATWLGYSVHRRELVTETLASSGGPFLFLRAGAFRRSPRSASAA